MCDKSAFRPAPKSEAGYDAMMEKKKEHPDITMWFTDQDCDLCGSAIFTDGKVYWCKKGCPNDGKRGLQDPEGFGFINDLIR
jgi:hypothetical protein